MVLNGINYTEKHLTDEEMAVVEAMRMGAKVQASFFFSTHETYTEHAAQVSTNTLPIRKTTDLGDGLKSRRIASEKVDIIHFVRT